MEPILEQRSGNWVAGLREFVGARAATVERCELCGTQIEQQHAHLFEPDTRHLLCTCAACAVLFASREARRYRRVPRDVAQLRDFQLSDAQWERFLIPINLAFFVRSSRTGRVFAMYPGPAGATESKLDLGAWDEIAAANSALGQLEDDVEALLVNRVQGARGYYRVPIDRCYQLVGLIRSRWHGAHGRDGADQAIARFFGALDAEIGA
ncbi:MAG: DUF5947 family protein [Steroidobacteraceae bacterium]